MVTQKPKVTLGYAASTQRYHIDQIRGNKPTVEFQEFPGDAIIVARVGMWLSEQTAEILGLSADLTVRLYHVDA